MKKILLFAIAGTFFLLLSITTFAQLKNGDLVRIKNVKSGMYAQPDSKSRINNVNSVPVNSNPPTTEKNRLITINPINLRQVNDEEILLYDFNEDDAQFWKVMAQKNGYYKFQNVNSSKFLSNNDDLNALNSPLQQRSDGDYPDLLWKLIKSGNGFKLKNKNNNLVAGVKEGAKEIKDVLIQKKDIAQSDIIWQFEVPNSKTPTASGKKVLFDVILNYLAVSEATRNRIDNGDCKRIFGFVSTELWQLDENNEMIAKLRSYNNMPEVIYNQTNYKNPPTAALSYYQDNRSASDNRQMGKVTYNLPESLLKEKKLMLIIKTYLGTRHKDNDFASYDALKMNEEVQNTYILDYRNTRSEIIETITDLANTNQNMVLLNFVIPYPTFGRADDTHKIWLRFSTKIN